MPEIPSKEKEKKKNKYYFDEDTQSAIIRFQNESNESTKQSIFQKEIQPAFSKLIENLIYVYKFTSIGDISELKNDCMSFLFEAIAEKKYREEKGNAFSYCNVIARNHFIQKSKNKKKRTEHDVSFDKTLLTKLEKNDNQAVVMSMEDDVLKSEFVCLLKEEIRKWRGKFGKDQEKRVLEAVIVLLENPDLIPIYKKKAVYMYVREMTGLNTKQVVTNLSKLKKKYRIFKKRYYDGEM